MGTWMAQAELASGARAVAWLMLAFILYGSLYPFDFHALPHGVGLERALRGAWNAPAGGRGDLLTNAVLYMPLGFALAAASRRFAPVALVAAALACGALSALVETIQLFLPDRTASGWDFVLNTAGGGVGALAAVLLGRTAPGWPRLRDGGAALLLAGWLGYRLYPFVPAIDRGEWVASIAPLAGPWNTDPVRVLRLAGSWLVAARLLAAALPGASAAAMMLATSIAAVPIIERVLTPAEVLAVALALPAWALLRGRRWADPVLLAVLLAVVLAEGLAPYRLAGWSRPFGWLPFGALMHGQYAAGLQAVMLKSFLYGGLLWLAVRCGISRVAAAVMVIGLAFAIGVVQTRLPGRSGEVTDAALALAAALVLRPGLHGRDRGG